MLDFGLTELIVIMLVALVVIKPADLPHVMVKAGKTWRAFKIWLMRTQNEVADIVHDFEVESYRQDAQKSQTPKDDIRGAPETMTPPQPRDYKDPQEAVEDNTSKSPQKDAG